MTKFEGALRLPYDDGPALDVQIDLRDDRMQIRSGASEIGDWDLGTIRVTALDDGFHVKAEGEEIILDVRRDAEFAVALGLRTAPPLLRRRMAALMR